MMIKGLDQTSKDCLHYEVYLGVREKLPWYKVKTNMKLKNSEKKREREKEKNIFLDDHKKYAKLSNILFGLNEHKPHIVFSLVKKRISSK